jgi:hypothetical protein|tara:strand:- start:50 stop:244 length:195 start_codon:yes stop_codon:yes gene_type:complete
MAGNMEVLLHRISLVIEEKYEDRELSSYIKKLNDVMRRDGYSNKSEVSIGKINREFHKKYLKEW